MVKLENNLIRRPNTEDTIRLFSQMITENGSCLVISNNPYIRRQARVTQRVLDQEKFPTYAAGPELNKETVNILITMDEFARTLYEEYLHVKRLSRY